jgi:transcriptional regulator with XRE-family HTH domain
VSIPALIEANRRGRTRQALADEVGVSLGTIESYVAGRRAPQDEATARRLADVLNVSYEVVAAAVKERSAGRYLRPASPHVAPGLAEAVTALVRVAERQERIAERQEQAIAALTSELERLRSVT